MSLEELEAPRTPVTWTSQILKPLAVFVLPMFIIAILTNLTALLFPKNPWIILLILVAGIPVAVVIPLIQLNKLGQELHGKVVHALTCRLKPGDVWADYGIVESVKPIHEENENTALKCLKDNLNLTSINKYIPYEITYERFEFGERMKRMILLSPCPYERLVIPQKADIIYKGLPIGASVAPLDVVIVAIADMGQENIKVAVPIGSDWHAEATQKLAGIFAVSKQDIEVAVQEYDAWKAVELQQKLITREKDLEALLEALADADEKASKKAAAAIKDYLLTEEISKELPSWLKMKKFWLIIGILAAIIVGLWLGGFIFG